MGDRLAASGFRPIEEEPCPCGVRILRLGPRQYRTGFSVLGSEEPAEPVWLDEHDYTPLFPTHSRKLPEDC